MPELTEDDVNAIAAHDQRVGHVQLGIAIETELAGSNALTIVLKAAGREAADALEELAEMDPTDTNGIINLQAKVYRARFIGRTLATLLKQAEIAERSLRDEGLPGEHDG